MNIQVNQITDITYRWELAKRLTGDTKAPEQVLKAIFQGCMNSLQKIYHTKFTSNLQDKVWDSVSKDRLATLNETLILDFCEKILEKFNDKEVNEILEEHKSTGFVNNFAYTGYLKTAYSFYKEDILETVALKANSMTNNFIPEIIIAVRKEGIQLPEPK